MDWDEKENEDEQYNYNIRIEEKLNDGFSSATTSKT